MTQFYNNDLLESALSQMEAAAFNFAHRYITDGNVRRNYLSQTKRLSQEYRYKVQTGEITVKRAAEQVQVIRNEIMEALRLRSSSIGRAEAENLKRTGTTLNELTSKYANKVFKRPFNSLSVQQQNVVYLKIVESGGRPNPLVNAAAQRFSALGRGLLVVTLGIAVYNIAVAEDKAHATAREGVVLGGGFAGGAAGGAVAGLACGPGAPVCVTVGVLIGGALGALGADVSFGWYF